MKEITVDGLGFCCDTPLEVWRAQSLFTKEPGTIEWLQQLQPGDVFVDIGANIGCYTLYAARRVGPTGAVHAFEPHLGNAQSLVRNVVWNGFADRVHVYPSTLSDHAGFVAFHCLDNAAGSSGHQSGHCRNEYGDNFVPIATLQMWAYPLDRIALPRHSNGRLFMKLDVDGNEAVILRGATETLAVCDSLQVEIHPGQGEVIDALCGAAGLTGRQDSYTAMGQKQIARGADPSSVIVNAVYSRVPVLA